MDDGERTSVTVRTEGYVCPSIKASSMSRRDNEKRVSLALLCYLDQPCLKHLDLEVFSGIGVGSPSRGTIKSSIS